MKLVVCDGRKLVVRDVGEPLYEVHCKGTIPIPHYISEIMDDAKARDLIQDLRSRGYNGGRPSDEKTASS